MKIRSLFCISILISLLMLSSTQINGEEIQTKGKSVPDMEEIRSPEETAAVEQTKADPEIAIMETSLGRIVLGFFPDVAPNHVARFKELAREGFYNGILFHRVIPNFMIQAGDPLTSDPNTPREMMGSGGSGKKLNAEFNKKPHLKGTLSAARSNHPDSADSQFFLCVARTPHLDNQYTVYGHVIEGLDVIDAIVNSERDKRDNPLEPIKILSVNIESRK